MLADSSGDRGTHCLLPAPSPSCAAATAASCTLIFKSDGLLIDFLYRDNFGEGVGEEETDKEPAVILVFQTLLSPDPLQAPASVSYF